jgi:hypothetical protein
MSLSLSGERRHVLRFLGLGSAAALLPAFRPGLVRAQPAAAPPRRFLAVLHHFGAPKIGYWYYQRSAALAEGPLVLTRILKPLEPWQKYVLQLDGIDNLANGPGAATHHGGSQPFSGMPREPGQGESFVGGITVDQVIANEIGKNSPVKSVQLGRPAAAYGDSIFATGRGQALPIITAPTKSFDLLFSGFVPPSSGATPSAPDPALAALRARNKSMFDYLSKEITALSGRLSGLDRQRMDNHLTTIREIEQRLTTPATVVASAACAKPATPGGGTGTDFVTQTQLDVLAAAFACDRTRVAGFKAAAADYNFLGITQGHHDISHLDLPAAPFQQENFTRIFEWNMQQLATRYFAKLATFTQSDGKSMLDHSLMMLTSETGNGPGHSPERYPVVLVGGAGGIRGGRAIGFGSRSFNDLLVSIVNAFGIAQTTFGPANLNKGPLPLT